jgi:DeoR family transcriptional regulator, fructose operon transcriptional repressor
MYATERQDQIMGRLESTGRVSVTELARAFDVTTETVRRDLDALEAVGALRRVHGGAVRWATAAELRLDERERTGRAAKRAIARAALELVPHTVPASIALDAGSTTAALVDLLLDWRPGSGDGVLDVITNAVPHILRLADNPRLAVHAVGGVVRPTTSAAVGATTIDALSRVRADVVFLGANGISAGFGLSTPDEREAGVKTALVHSARRRIALVDATKHGEESLLSFAALADLDTLVTDAPPPAELSRALADADVDVIVAS